MYKYILSFIFILSTTLKVDAQLNTNLLYHWEDTTLVGSTAYNNTYNEIWGLNINGYEFAVIGSTAGYIFLILLIQQMQMKLLLLLAHIQVQELFIEIIMTIMVIFILFVMKDLLLLFK